jgi:hypothetical protein
MRGGSEKRMPFFFGSLLVLDLAPGSPDRRGDAKHGECQQVGFEPDTGLRHAAAEGGPDQGTEAEVAVERAHDRFLQHQLNRHALGVHCNVGGAEPESVEEQGCRQGDRVRRERHQHECRHEDQAEQECRAVAAMTLDQAADELERRQRADRDEQQQRSQLRGVEIQLAGQGRDSGDPPGADESHHREEGGDRDTRAGLAKGVGQNGLPE